MNSDILITLFLPMIAGLVYFFMAYEVKRTSKFRALMFGEIGFRKLETAFILFGIYFITRPLQNILGPYPMPVIINCIRQFFLMAIIAPSILVAIFHWVPAQSGAPNSSKFAAYVVAVLMAVVFVLINTAVATSSQIIYSGALFDIHDAVWFSEGAAPFQLIAIHLICQFVSPVGFFLLSVAYIKHRRHNYTLANVYNLMPTKWKYLEISLIVFASSFIIAGLAVAIGRYYTYIWAIYFVGAIISGLFGLKSIKLPPREQPSDLK
ncbi:MAG: hypothetical protein LBV16_00280 [Elusimicrobiota bacterium]|jgi:hypothetical protein|nr:hypothetical protein [Elusimicrobiota bacterium]